MLLFGNGERKAERCGHAWSLADGDGNGGWCDCVSFHPRFVYGDVSFFFSNRSIPGIATTMNRIIMLDRPHDWTMTSDSSLVHLHLAPSLLAYRLS